MSELIPFDFDGGLPAHLRGVDVKQINSDLTAHASGFPVISIKGKVFAVVRDGDRQVLPNPKDPDSAATSIEVVLLKANRNVSKVFYMNGYDPAASEGQKPDCYSSDGVTPEADSSNKQAPKCAVCKHNEWGSKINDKGVATKGKSCNDTVRMAIAPNGQLNDPHLLRVPAGSIRNLGEYGRMLEKRGCSYNAVITKVSFDNEAESPKLMFKAIGFLSADDYGMVKETIEGTAVASILDSAPVATAAEAGIKEQPAEVEAKAADKAVEKPVKPKPTKVVEKPVEVKKTEPVKTVEASSDEFEIELDGINFDD